jgi:NodT family efflux transporter outer membrane factor (OMF) lipoprotein
MPFRKRFHSFNFGLLLFLGLILSTSSCKTPQIFPSQLTSSLPCGYRNSPDSLPDSLNIAAKKWRQFYTDPYLAALIDSALRKNQELNIIRKEIEVARNEVKEKKADYLPFVTSHIGLEGEKPGLFTRNGAVEHNLDVMPGRAFPDPMQNYEVGFIARWELDVWRKLRNARDAAFQRYLATEEAQNFVVTQIVAEIAEGYYELMALDNLLDIVDKNAEIQSQALRIMQQQKDNARVTQLAVNRFSAQLLNTQNRRFTIQQKIVETENRLRYLTGTFKGPVPRSSERFLALNLDSMRVGIPSQLLLNRPDIRRAEHELLAAGLDVKVARAQFFPTIGLRAGLGFQAFNPAFLINPESLLFNLAGDLIAPLVNYNAIKASLNKAKARQVAAAVRYQQTILNGYLDVLNQLNKLENYSKSLEKKQSEVDILMQAVTIANSLFNSARADYAEVLLTQREALEAKMELVEIKLKQLQAGVNLYRALGGGWR